MVTTTSQKTSVLIEHLGATLAARLDTAALRECMPDQQFAEPIRGAAIAARSESGVTIMAVSKRLRFEVLRRDGNTCRYCGATAPEAKITVDHVIPKALGGTDDPTNLVAACSPCNAGKSASNPDAAVVANVADDALRWAAAIRQSAEVMLADLAHRETQRREFRAEWDNWTFGSKKMRVPLPDDWERSVENFLAAGLPMPLLIDAVRKAMRADKVVPGATFRYMCGIAWKLVGELQDRARGVVSASIAKPASPTLASEFIPEVWGNSPIDITDEVITDLASRFRDQRSEDEEQPWLTWNDDECAAAWIVGYVSQNMICAEIAPRLLRMLTPSARQHWIDQSALIDREVYEVDEISEGTIRYAACLAFRHYAEMAGDVEVKRGGF